VEHTSINTCILNIFAISEFVFLGLCFSSGVRVLLDASLVRAAAQNALANQQLTALLGELADIKQRLPPNSLCGAYVSQHTLGTHGKLLHKWQLTGLLQPLQPLQQQHGTVPCLISAKQVRMFVSVVQAG
jgi:hypothetical protein